MSNLIQTLLAILVLITGITRDVDPELTAIAEQRATETSTDATFSHDLRRDGTWEVLAWNLNAPDPAALAAEQWQTSPSHWAILTDPTLTRIGCGHAVGPDGRNTFACVLLPSATTQNLPSPAVPDQMVVPAAPAVPSEAPIMLLPDTAMAP